MCYDYCKTGGLFIAATAPAGGGGLPYNRKRQEIFLVSILEAPTDTSYGRRLSRIPILRARRGMVLTMVMAYSRDSLIGKK